MGRGRKGPLSQSRKKTKTPKNRLTTQHTLFIGEPEKGQIKDPPIHISEELLTAMKKMSPQDLKNSLIKPEQQEEEVEEIYEMIEEDEKLIFEDIDPNEPFYETPIMTPELYYRIMTNEFSREQVYYMIKKGFGYLIDGEVITLK